MAKLTWGAIGTRFYETGIDRGVLYPRGGTPASWSGLTKVTNKNSPGGPTASYFDGEKYSNMAGVSEFSATLEAYSYPAEFELCDGTYPMSNKGLFGSVDQRVIFGLSYRTKLGNDLNAEYGYRIHLLYNMMASPAPRDYVTINDSPESLLFSWEMASTAVVMSDYGNLSHVIVNSATTPAGILAHLEQVLYGDVGIEPRLPPPSELILIFQGAIAGYGHGPYGHGPYGHSS